MCADMRAGMCVDVFADVCVERMIAVQRAKPVEGSKNKIKMASKCIGA